MSTPAAPRGGSLPRWVWAVIVLLVVVTALAVTVATFAVRGRDVLNPPAATTLPAPTHSEGAGTTSPQQQDLVAVGCLGGAANLDAAVLDAQARAPRTPAGAAAFAATLVRWAGQLPPSRYQRTIAARLLTDDATKMAVEALGSAERTWPAGKTARFDFASGRYYVEEFRGNEAVITYWATVHGVENAQILPDASVSSTLHFRLSGNAWRLFDVTSTRSLAESSSIGTAYIGGC